MSDPSVRGEELNWENSTSVTSSDRSFIIHVPAMAHGGDSLSYPKKTGEMASQYETGYPDGLIVVREGERIPTGIFTGKIELTKHEPIRDYNGNIKEGRGLVFYNGKDNVWQGVSGDGTGIIIINEVNDEQASVITAAMEAARKDVFRKAADGDAARELQRKSRGYAPEEASLTERRANNVKTLASDTAIKKGVQAAISLGLVDMDDSDYIKEKNIATTMPVISRKDIDMTGIEFPVISSGRKFVIPVHELPDGGEPMVFWDAATSSMEPVRDYKKDIKTGNGFVFFNPTDKTWQGAPGDGTGIIIINEVNEEQADILLDVLKNARGARKDVLNSVLAEAEKMGLNDRYDSNTKFMKTKLNVAGNVEPGGAGLYIRGRDINRAWLLPISGAKFQGPAGQPQEVMPGDVILWDGNPEDNGNPDGGSWRRVKGSVFATTWVDLKGQAVDPATLPVGLTVEAWEAGGNLPSDPLLAAICKAEMKRYAEKMEPVSVPSTPAPGI